MRQLSILCVSLAVAGSMTVGGDVSIDEVVLLARAGFAEGVILQALNRHHPDGRLSTEALGKLRSGGVQERVLEMLQCDGRRVKQIELLDPGVYRKRGEEYVLMEAERARWRATTMPVSVATSALTGLRVTALVENAESHLRLNGRAELLIVPAPGQTASEYQLFRAETKDGWREVKGEAALRAGKLLGVGASDGISLYTLLDHSFDLGVRAPLRTLRKGEYVLVPPRLIVAGHVASEFEVYTFGID